MTNKELIKEVTSVLAEQNLTLTQKTVKAVSNALFEVMLKHAAEGTAVKLPFGICTRKLKPTRTYRNPTNGTPITVKEHYVPLIKFNKPTKERFK